MRYRFVLYAHGPRREIKVVGKIDYETPEIALDHGKYLLDHSLAYRVVVIDERRHELLRYDKEEKK